MARLATNAAPPTRAPRAWPARGAGVLAVAAATETDAETETDTRTRIAPPWNVVVHDDPVTLMNYVVKVFRDVFGYAESKAHRLMLEVHNTGRSVVWTGAREQAEAYVQKLIAAHLRTTLEQNAT